MQPFLQFQSSFFTSRRNHKPLSHCSYVLTIPGRDLWGHCQCITLNLVLFWTFYIERILKFREYGEWLFFPFHSVFIVHPSCSKYLYFIPFYLWIHSLYKYILSFIFMCQFLDCGSCISPYNYCQCIYETIFFHHIDRLLKLRLIWNICLLCFLLVRAVNTSLVYSLLRYSEN